MLAYQRDFIDLAVSREALLFGEFKLKSGRMSPYFFNAGRFCDGASLNRLGACYADAVVASGIPFDFLFGPAYKGIPLAVATAMALARHHDRETPWCFNRKEAKDHGEGGMLVGAPAAGRALIVDDVITAGTAIRDAAALLRNAGATLAGVVLGLDRRERGRGACSATQEVAEELGVPVMSIIDIDNIIEYLDTAAPARVATVRDYRRAYGV
ncbi:MAG: orotate phosphoribosyltransferase [Gammaproteobacteria bacterium]|nr:orotate phosphoribosyltransferase [Gammaproteobacteria bacterium]MBK8133956.1 orotate phosphoribosyltransferase [Gammaproteobacteria bacterium]